MNQTNKEISMHNDFSKMVDIEIRFPIKMSIAVFIPAVLFDLSPKSLHRELAWSESLNLEQFLVNPLA